MTHTVKRLARSLAAANPGALLILFPAAVLVAAIALVVTA